VHTSKKITIRNRGKGGTNISLKELRAVFELEQLDSTKQRSWVGEEIAHLSFSCGYVLEASGFLEPRFLHPVKGKPIQEVGVEFAATDFEELPFEALV